MKNKSLIVVGDPGDPPRYISLCRAVHFCPSLILSLAFVAIGATVFCVIGSIVMDIGLSMLLVSMIISVCCFFSFHLVVIYYRTWLRYCEAVPATIVAKEPYGLFSGWVSFAQYTTIRYRYVFNEVSFHGKYVVERGELNEMINSSEGIWVIVSCNWKEPLLKRNLCVAKGKGSA